jgi:hypothetical protein
MAIIVVLMSLTASAQTLVHEYNFTDDGTGTNVVDSVGGTAWYGTLPNGGDFASLPGQLLLSASGAQYVQLPAGILSNYTAVTIDCWATFGILPSACFLYGFGDTDTNTGYGQSYIFCQPQNGRIAISPINWPGEQGCGGAGNLSSRTVHVTSVYNPVAGYVELYTNGVLVSANNAVTVQMSSISNQLNYIARSLYNGDQYFDVALDEFRIWDGALNPLQVAGCDVAGPDTVSTNAGTVTSIQLSVPQFQLVQGTHEAGSVTAQATLVPYPFDITRLATLSSGNTNIIQINSTNGLIMAVGQGSANVIASYSSLTSTQIITVVQPASALVHRYSFTTDTSDSVGGAAWAGTLVGSASVSGGQLVISNTAQTAPAPDYLLLPDGIITNAENGIGTYFNDPAVTVEAWATFAPSQGYWSALFDFGYQNGSGQAAYDIHLGQLGGSTVFAISDSDNANVHNQSGTAGSLRGQTNMQVVVVFNPPAGYLACYTNGVLASVLNNVTISMAGVHAVLNKIGADLWPDPGMQGSVSEFRIYNGALTSQGIAISSAAGPDSVPAAVTNGPGALLSLSIQAPATLTPPLLGSVKLLANYANLSNWDIIGNSVFPPAGLTVTTSDTNVLVYGTDSKLHGVNPGTASVVVVYQGTTNTASVTVVQAAPSTLVHRYSFDDANGSTTVADSVGGAAWNGTVMANGTNMVPAPGAFTNGVLSLRAANTNYVQLPGGILSNYTAVTIEIWADLITVPVNCTLWSFGGTDPNVLSGGQASGYNCIFCAPQAGNITISDQDPSWWGGQGASDVNWNGRTNFHVTAVFNQPAGYLVVYTNGVLARSASETIPMSSVSNVLSYIGRSLYNADPYPNLNVSEFRIYNGAMSPNDVKVTQLLGPGQTLATSPSINAAVSGGNVVLSWPEAAGAFALQSRTNLISGTWTTVSSPVAQLVGSQWQITVPNSGGNMFYRLVR